MKRIIATTGILLTWAVLGWKETEVITTNGGDKLITREYQDPTNHFSWMSKQYGIAEVGGPPYVDDPEWHYINFGHNPVRWLTFRRGDFGAGWNWWQPEKTWLQSTFEPIVIQTNGIWLITFKR